MSGSSPSLIDMLDLSLSIDVVDIGANPLAAEGESAPYKTLLQAGHATVVGFEPNLEALETLNENKGAQETYLPHAVYDGLEQTLRICRAPGMTSLLEPNADLLNCVQGFDHWGAVLDRETVQTVRLDDIPEIENIDLLKIDIQGAELEVLRNGTERLADCLVIQTEVEFVPMYRDQPLFSDVDIFLREQGFMLHRYDDMQSRALKPILVNNDPYAPLSQLLWADAIYVRDFTKLDLLGPDKLLKLALILHDIYSSFDLAVRVLLVRDAMVGTRMGQAYLQKLEGS